MKNAALYAGAGSALAVGLVLGVAMRPHLGAVDGAAVAPQPPADDISSARAPVAAPAEAPAAAAADDDSFAGYTGKLPDYVRGTDWKRLTEAVLAPPPAPASDAQTPPRSYYVSPLTDEQPQTAPPLQTAEAAAPAAATGTASDVSAEAAAWAAALPPPALAIDPEEAPPEATGDTRIDR